MIYEINNFTNGGLSVEEPPKPVIEKQGIKVGDICRAKSEMFQGWLRCEVVKLYKNSALVNIIACRNPEDDATQRELGDVTIVRLKDLTVLKG